MLSVTTDEQAGIAILEPHGALSKEDFERAAQAIDPYLERSQRLNGLVVRTKDFPGWDSFAALSSHLQFVRGHHRKISRIALCTDSVIGNFAKLVAPHFVAAEIRVFGFQEFDRAKTWVATGDSP
jgi:hypothetical protein